MYLLLAALLACNGDNTDDSSTSDDTGAPADDTSEVDTGNGPPGGATVDNACAPDDGPALVFAMGLADSVCGASASSSGYLKFTIYTPRDGPLPEGAEFRWNASEGSGEGTYTAGADQGWETVVGGWVRIDTWAAGADVTGAYEVRLESGATVGDSFSGPYCNSTVTCG